MANVTNTWESASFLYLLGKSEDSGFFLQYSCLVNDARTRSRTYLQNTDLVLFFVPMLCNLDRRSKRNVTCSTRLDKHAGSLQAGISIEKSLLFVIRCSVDYDRLLGRNLARIAMFRGMQSNS